MAPAVQIIVSAKPRGQQFYSSIGHRASSIERRTLSTLPARKKPMVKFFAIESSEKRISISSPFICCWAACIVYVGPSICHRLTQINTQWSARGGGTRELCYSAALCRCQLTCIEKDYREIYPRQYDPQPCLYRTPELAFAIPCPLLRASSTPLLVHTTSLAHPQSLVFFSN